MTRVPPVSFAQLMQLMVDALLTLMPMSLAHILVTEREGFSVYLWPILGSMCLASFYQGAMMLVANMDGETQ